MADLETMLSTMRRHGWVVGCHNDYHKDGILFSFWLFTHREGRYVKAEGFADAPCALIGECMRQAGVNNG